MTAIDDDDEEEEVAREWRKTWDEIAAEFCRLQTRGLAKDIAAWMAYDEVVLRRIKRRSQRDGRDELEQGREADCCRMVQESTKKKEDDELAGQHQQGPKHLRAC